MTGLPGPGPSRRGFGRGALALAAAPLLTAVPARAAGTASTASLIPPSGAHLGAYNYIGDDTGVSGPEPLESKLGQRLGINHCFQMYDAAPPLARMRTDLAAGRIPMLSWAAGDTARLRAILAGTHDAWIDGQARALGSLGAPLLLRFTWEFDLRYADSALFKDVWRYVHGRFAREAPLVAFVWCPTWRAYRETAKAEPFYPGDAYVDWIGADGYARPRPAEPAYDYRPFSLLFDAAHAFAVDRGKPFVVGETGVHRADSDPVQAAWLTAAHGAVKESFPGLKALVYFHRDGEQEDAHWRVTVPDGGPAQRAFTAIAADPWFSPTGRRRPRSTAPDRRPSRP
ncbi:glycoside hydrolase family 26 protein [Streptomyces indicus]|uniref:Glycosyl hydrolase family 26 n=1 Tax=Streptomyces indicus TaxID=417292 RepID=A0A1G8UP15_9ACTN|nr:glycosyl hydrolase [Streptomyces indicus]SDJ55592.1 Glycosyl hydrolase family 26 [Streptomyces indicus]